MTDTKDLIREIQEHTAAHGGENTATHLLVQAVMALQRQADELAAIGAGGVEPLRKINQPEPTVPDQTQDWAGMDGATAYLLIQRHADNWADAAKMMGEWLDANQRQSFDAADMATASAQGFRDGAAATAQPVAEQGVASAALPDEREAFEAMMRSQTFDSLKRLSDGSYESYEARVGWLAWNVRASHGRAPAGATLPDGWVPLMLTHEGQYPEEVAYGPQIMMDRLGKWLGKYFAQAARPDSVMEDAARHFFDAGWKACANFCDRDDVRFDGIVGHRGCPQFEEAFRAARKQGGAT